MVLQPFACKVYQVMRLYKHLQALALHEKACKMQVLCTV